MSCRKSVVWLILLLVPALLGPQNSALAQIFSGTSRLRMMGRAADGANYFAIMGHIKYPQTYLLPTSGPSLVDFIRFSGGALSTTNGQILIVRGERIVQQTMLTANSTIKLMPGDLVIIDGGRSGRGTIFRATENGPQRGASDASTRPLQIALIGVKPYPIIMQMTPDVATKRWIVRQLGQDASVAGSVKALQRRRMSGPSGLDSRLSDNSVLIFPEGTIDTSRLPALPRPFRAGVDRQLDQQTQAKRTPSQPPGGAAAQIPVPVPQIVTSDTEPPTGASTPPGQSKVSATPEPDSAASVESSPAQTLLTHPGSVALDEQQTALPGRAFVSDTGTASSGPVVRNQTVPVHPTSPEHSEQADSEVSFREGPGTGATTQEAVRPFVSQPEQALTPVRPEPAPQPDGTPRDAGSTALQLTPVVPRQSTGSAVNDASATDRTESPASATDRTAADLSLESSLPSVELIDPPRQTAAGHPAESSLALQGVAGLPGSNPTQHVTRPASSVPVSVRLPDQTVLEQTPGNGRPTDLPETGVPGQRTDADSGSPGSDSSTTPRSQIVPRQDPPSRWPLIAAGVIGSLGFLAAFSLLLSMTGPGPQTPAPVPVSDRYWLDRIIKDDLPVQDEPTLEPTVSSLFVQPMDARALRPDAAHRQVPRPHFPDRRPQSGIGQPDTPQPDIPVPDANRPDSEDDTHPGRIRPQQPAAPTRNPGVPLAPAAESMTAVVEPVEVSAASVTAPRQKQRIVRTDSSHRSEAPMEHSADRPPGPAGRGPVRPADAHSSKHSEITVRPARSVVEGADLLDRVLASVNSSQNDERTAQKEQKGQS